MDDVLRRLLQENNISITRATCEPENTDLTESSVRVSVPEPTYTDEDLSEILIANNIAPETFIAHESTLTEVAVPEENRADSGSADDRILIEMPEIEVAEDSGNSAEETDPLIIAENSPSLLVTDTSSRFSGAEWYDEAVKAVIIVAGIGGIGSWLSLLLARLKPAAIYLYDFDTVESANMSGQLYRVDAVGSYKVDAMLRTIMDYSENVPVYTRHCAFAPGNARDIMMCGFDNMAARSEYFSAWKTHVMDLPAESRKNCLFMDGRLNMDTFQVLCITGNDQYCMNKYETEFLFDDSEAQETVCSMKQTTYTACMIASIMTNLFVNFLANKTDPLIPYSTPFFTEYNARNMIFRVED